MEQVDINSRKRALKAFRCLPFSNKFYKDAQKRGLDAEFVFSNSEIYCGTSFRWFRSSSSVEDSFRGLIKIGALRREVDGQGLTSSIRLTPFGREINEKYPELSTQKANLFEKISQWLNRKFLW